MKRATGYQFAVSLPLLLLFGGARAGDASRALESFGSPGYLPDHPGYAIDRLRERFDLAFAASDAARVDLSLRFAREKLAETEVMVRAGDAGLAWVAGGLYRDYLERAANALAELPEHSVTARREAYVTELGDHVLLLARHYPSMPLEVRNFVLKPLVNAALLQIETQRRLMQGRAAATVVARMAELERATGAMWRADSERHVEQR